MNVKEKSVVCSENLIKEVPFALAELEESLFRLLLQKAFLQGVAQGAADAHRRETKEEDFISFP